MDYTYTVMEWPPDQPPPPFAPMILRSDGATIPSDPENLDYQAYLVWLADQPTKEPRAPVHHGGRTVRSKR